MANLQVASLISFTQTTTKTLELSEALTEGSALIVAVVYFHDAQRNVALTDSLGHSFTQVSNGVFPFYNATDDVGVALFYVTGVTAGENELTATFINQANSQPDVTDTGGAIIAFEESEIADESPLIVTTIQRLASPGTSAGAVTPGVGNITTQPAIVYAVAFNNANEVAPSANVGDDLGTAFVDSGSGFGRASRARVTATGNYASTFTVGSGQGSNTHYAMQFAFTESAEDEGTPADAEGAGATATVTAADGKAEAISATLEFTGTGGFFEKDNTPVDAEGLTFYIWHASRPTGTPDQIITDVSIEDGELSLQIEIADLSDGDPVSWFVFDPDDENTAIFSAGVSQVSIG